jgi:hypothetical protein
MIFLIELFQSYFADLRNVKVVTRKKWKAVIYDIIAESTGWIILVFVIVNWMYPPYIVSAVMGNALGTFMVAGRKIKKKKTVYRKKMPFSSA